MNKPLFSIRDGGHAPRLPATPCRHPGCCGALLLTLLLLLAGCGGPPPGTPTPLPASVRPDQPTPVYPGGAAVFALDTPAFTPIFVTPASAATELAATALAETNGADGQRAAIKLFIENQTPSAVGIAVGGATIYREQGSGAVGSVPVGGVLTVTGKSADGRWYSVYDDAAAFGWVPAGQVRVYGGEDLVVVDQPLNPAPIMTLLAQAGRPVRVLDDLMPQMAAAQAASATQVAALVATAPPAPPTTRPEPATEQSTAEQSTAEQSTAEPGPAEQSPAQPSPAEPGTAEPGPASAAVAQPTPPAPATPEPAATPTVVVVGLPVPTATVPLRWVVAGDARVNLRTQPETTAPIIRKLDPGSSLTVVGRSADNRWLRVQVDGGFEGWVAAEFVQLQ